MHRRAQPIETVAVAGLFLIAIAVLFIWLALAAKSRWNTIASRVPPCAEDCTTVFANAVRTVKGGATFDIPKEYLEHFDQSDWRPDPNKWETRIQAKWPSMSAFTMQELDALFKEWDKTGRDPHTPNFLTDLVTIKIREHGSLPTPTTSEDLERVVQKRFGSPIRLQVLPELQEYSQNPRNNAYRPIDQSIRLADGMPAYLFCSGKPLAQSTHDLAGGCLIQMTWPNGFEVDIKFNRQYLAEWHQVHGKSIELLQSFAVERTLPSGSLLREPASIAPNPSVKGTSTSGLRPLAATPYVER